MFQYNFKERAENIFMYVVNIVVDPIHHTRMIII